VHQVSIIISQLGVLTKHERVLAEGEVATEGRLADLRVGWDQQG
jgi:hypothetical protein